MLLESPTFSFFSWRSELPERTTLHATGRLAPPWFARSFTLKYRHRKLRSVNSLVITLGAWKLKKVRRRPRHNLDIPSYSKPLREPILSCMHMLESKWRHFSSSKLNQLCHWHRPWLMRQKLPTMKQWRYICNLQLGFHCTSICPFCWRSSLISSAKLLAKALR